MATTIEGALNPQNQGQTVPENSVTAQKGRRGTEIETHSGTIPQKSDEALSTFDNNKKPTPSKRSKTEIAGGSNYISRKTVPDQGAVVKLIGWIYSFSHKSAGLYFELREGKTTIGSNSDKTDICLAEDKNISSIHCKIIYRPQEKYLFVYDEHTTNGTFVNGKGTRGQEVELKDGDEITVGETVFTLRLIKELCNNSSE